MKKPGLFDVLKEMSIRNMEISRSDGAVENLNRQVKRGGGTMTIGMASPAFDWVINGLATDRPTHLPILVVFSVEQYEQVEKELMEKGFGSKDMDTTFK